MSKHTPEPWIVCDLPYDRRLGVLCSIYGGNGEKHGVVGTTKNSRFDPAVRITNAKRIVACVNFCEGFSDKQLAEMESLKDVLASVDLRPDEIAKANAWRKDDE